MGILTTLIGFLGFGVGLFAGIIAGYFLFIFFQSIDVKNPSIPPLVEQDEDSLRRLLPQIPLWVKCPDFDRVDWLNTFIAYIWPYLDTAICKSVKDIAKPIIAEKIPNYKIESVEFEELTLGTLPPVFQGIKVYLTEEKELIMEISLKWAGNPNFIISVGALGMKATLQIVDAQVFAVMRVTLKPLVPSFPCFSNIYISLMEKPYIDFGLKVVGADVMSVPALYGFVQGIISQHVANLYLWPRYFEVQILDPAKASRRPVGILHVKVLRAVKLNKKDFMGSSDPYVKLKLADDKLPSKKTTVRHKNLNPEWNEEFNLVVKDPETQILELHVYDWEQVGKDEKMGMNVVPLKGLPHNEAKVVTLELLKNMNLEDERNEKRRGHIEVELMYKPFKMEDMVKGFDGAGMVMKAPEGTPAGGGVLVVIVHEAQDLEGKHHNNPHVRVIYKGEEKRTKHMKKSRDPRWGEEFQFVLEEPPVNDRIHIEVVSTSSRIGLLHPKEALGYVDINLSDVVNNKRINERYHLIDSKNGRIQIELQWRTPS